MKFSIYARESEDDTSKAPSIESQIETGKAWIQENSYNLVNIYKDNGFSGGDWKRLAWNQLVKDAKRHLFNAVWVWNQDRIARNTEQFLWFYRNLNNVKVKVYSHTEGWIDMESLGGRVKHTTLAMAAEIFRLTTSEKVKKKYEFKKKEAEKQNGKVVWGRPQIAVNLKKILELKNKGLGYRNIAKEYFNDCGIKISYQKVRRALLNTHTNF